MVQAIAPRVPATQESPYPYTQAAGRCAAQRSKRFSVSARPGRSCAFDFKNDDWLSMAAGDRLVSGLPLKNGHQLA